MPYDQLSGKQTPAYAKVVPLSENVIIAPRTLTANRSPVFEINSDNQETQPRENLAIHGTRDQGRLLSDVLAQPSL